MIKIAINGFGRIGRAIARLVFKNPNFQLVAINSSANASSHAYLWQYDSVYGRFEYPIKATGSTLITNGQKIQTFQQPNIANIPWEKTQAQVIIDSSGRFKTKPELANHLKGQVKLVISSCPAKDNLKTIILGVNENEYEPTKHSIVSTASCTTMCLATIAKILHQEFEIIEGMMSTVHAVTTSQNLLDSSNKNVRRRRAAFLNIIPTGTGASQALAKVIPELAGKIECLSIRVPIATVSLIDLNVVLKKKTTTEKINQVFEKYARGKMKGILGVAKHELTSADFIGDPRSAIVDPFLTKVLPGNLAKVIAWYDNEWAYCQRILDLIEFTQSAQND